jgi:transcriptional regulator with XRE-family HTH domain
MGAGLGAKLRAIRQQWRLSLREVEQRSFRVAEERGSESYQISASWLDRLEREQHELTVNKLLALAEIYNVSAEVLLRTAYPGQEPTFLFAQPPRSKKAGILLPGPLDLASQMLLSNGILASSSTENTGLMPAESKPESPYRVGIIGERDLTLDPMVRPGSVVLIDTRNREISTRKDWAREFQRPIYFLMTRDAYFCGWCELDQAKDRLTLIPHPLSPAPSRRWKYRTEIENLGRVVMVAIRMQQ